MFLNLSAYELADSPDLAGNSVRDRIRVQEGVLQFGEQAIRLLNGGL